MHGYEEVHDPYGLKTLPYIQDYCVIYIYKLAACADALYAYNIRQVRRQ